MEPVPFLVGGRWTTGDGASFSVMNPATRAEIGVIAAASAKDVDEAVSAARAALSDPKWCGLKFHERARILYRFADLIDTNAEHLAQTQMRSNGKTISECRAQTKSAAGTFRYYAAVCETFQSNVTTQRGASLTLAVSEPVGVVAAITPWNSPLTLEAQKLAPILAAGNTVVLKPSEITPQIGLEYGRLGLEAGLPAGVLNVVTGAGDVGRALVEHPGCDMISFTGGTAAGRAIAEAAGRQLKPVVLELGGKSPNIVFADADLDAAAVGVANGIFSSGGQSCIAGSRVFVEQSVFADFLERMRRQAETFKLGPPDAADTKIGPMATFRQREHVAGYVDVARSEGGRTIIGGEMPSGGIFDAGAYYPATIIIDVTNKARVCREEIFGPVAVVMPFTDEADVIAEANDSDFGLAAGIWTADYRKAWRVGRALRAGTVWINIYKELSISTPFGGFKQSGIGREKGVQGMQIYMEQKGLYLHLG